MGKNVEAMSGKIIGVIVALLIAGALLPEALGYFDNFSTILKVFFATLVPLGIGYGLYKVVSKS